MTKEQYRVWPDGDTQAVAEGGPHPWKSKDFILMYAEDDYDAYCMSKHAFGDYKRELNTVQHLRVIAQEKINVNQVKGSLLMYCSEIASLRLHREFFNKCKCEQGFDARKFKHYFKMEVDYAKH